MLVAIFTTMKSTKKKIGPASMAWWDFHSVQSFFQSQFSFSTGFSIVVLESGCRLLLEEDDRIPRHRHQRPRMYSTQWWELGRQQTWSSETQDTLVSEKTRLMFRPHNTARAYLSYTAIGGRPDLPKPHTMLRGSDADKRFCWNLLSNGSHAHILGQEIRLIQRTPIADSTWKPIWRQLGHVGISKNYDMLTNFYKKLATLLVTRKMVKLVDNACLWQKKLNLNFWKSMCSQLLLWRTGVPLWWLMAEWSGDCDYLSVRGSYNQSDEYQHQVLWTRMHRLRKTC